MADRTQEILTQLGGTLLTDLKESLQRNGNHATGKTAAALRFEASEDRLRIFAPAHIATLVTGRKPTSEGARNASGATLLENIKEWIAAKGLDLNPYAVTNKIHREGTALFRSGQRSDVIDRVINKQRITSMTETLLDHVNIEVAQILRQRFRV